MIYQKKIYTPANTSQIEAVSTVLRVTSGLVYKVEVYFPPGSAGLLRVMIKDGGSQVWPLHTGEWFEGEDITIAFDDTYLKLSAPFEFSIYTYNLDDTYPHIVIVRIGIVTEEVFMARFLPTYTYKYFIDMLGKLEAEQKVRQEEERKRILSSPFSWT